MRAVIDHDRCTGHGRCYALAPEIFEPDDVGEGRVLGDGTVPTQHERQAQVAAANCPERAITIEESA